MNATPNMTNEQKTEKLYGIFRNKLDEIRNNARVGHSFKTLDADTVRRYDNIGAIISDKIEEYLSEQGPHVRSLHADNLVHLINEGPLDAVAIRNHVNYDNIIVIEREYAEKILVLGLP